MPVYLTKVYQNFLALPDNPRMAVAFILSIQFSIILGALIAGLNIGIHFLLEEYSMLESITTYLHDFITGLAYSVTIVDAIIATLLVMVVVLIALMLMLFIIHVLDHLFISFFYVKMLRHHSSYKGVVGWLKAVGISFTGIHKTLLVRGSTISNAHGVLDCTNFLPSWHPYTPERVAANLEAEEKLEDAKNAEKTELSEDETEENTSE